MKHIRLIVLALAFPGAMPSIAYSQGVGIEWDILNREVVELYNAGKYDRAVVVAPEALKIAKLNAGLGHPAMASVLENLAALYRTTMRNEEAEALEKRAARIRAIKR